MSIFVLLFMLASVELVATNPAPTALQLSRLADFHSGVWRRQNIDSAFDYVAPNSSVSLRLYNWPPTVDRKVSIFLVGDSLDRKIVQAASGICTTKDYFSREAKACTTSMSGEVPFFGLPRNDSFACDGEHLTVTNLFTRGVMQGAHQDAVCETGAPAGVLPSIEFASKQFMQRYGPPDVVVLKTFFWDVLHLCSLDLCTGVKNTTILSGLVKKFEEDTSTVVQSLREAFPSSMIALRTDPQTSHEDAGFGGNAEAIRQLGMHLNAIIRHVAQTEGIMLFDFFRVFEGLPPTLYLQDDMHIHDQYSRLELNVMIRTVQ